jgi:xylan 1,4-beta-xylosidase
MITNPILPGFNPDPSICRAGSDYYIATSTFEWYPGVQIHHSTDLVNWRLVARPLRRASQLDMRGNPDSCGVWAPCLSYADGRFWLVYTDVKRFDGAFKDSHNYIVTADAVDGDWSDPIYVNSSGFDPSLFHAPDGRKWFLNMRWNHRGPGSGVNPAHDAFDGILAQEWSEAGGLTGPVTNIYAGTDLGLTEASHLFYRNGWYYLTTAEGGTGYDHAVTMARSRDVLGPYETHPNKHLMTTRFDPDYPLQRVGHGQYVDTPTGEVYHTYLCGRPLPGRFCTLGRETGLARCVWGADDWLYLEGGGLVPPLTLELDAVANVASAEVSYQFDGAALPDAFQWLRTPEPGRIFTLTGRALRLFGRESLGSWFEQALVARRQEHHSYDAETLVEFAPASYQQAAGLTTYYNRFKFHAAMISHEAGIGRVLNILSCPGNWPGGELVYPMAPLPIADGPVMLRVEVRGARQQFYWKQAGDWAALGPELDASAVSDEGGVGEHGSFTGAFVGMVAFDITGRGTPADFAYFNYAAR